MTEKGKKRPSYSEEFKAEAIEMCSKIGIAKTSNELGVSTASLRNWTNQAGREPRIPDGKPSYQDLEKKIARLQKEIGYINEINKVLKKSTAIFSSSEMGGLK